MIPATKAAWTRRWWMTAEPVPVPATVAAHLERIAENGCHTFEGPTADRRAEAWWLRLAASWRGEANALLCPEVRLAELLRANCTTAEREGRGVSHIDEFMKRAHEMRDQEADNNGL